MNKQVTSEPQMTPEQEQAALEAYWLRLLNNDPTLYESHDAEDLEIPQKPWL